MMGLPGFGGPHPLLLGGHPGHPYVDMGLGGVGPMGMPGACAAPASLLLPGRVPC